MALVKRVHRLAYRNTHLIPNHHACGEVSNAHVSSGFFEGFVASDKLIPVPIYRPATTMNGVDQADE